MKIAGKITCRSIISTLYCRERKTQVYEQPTGMTEDIYLKVTLSNGEVLMLKDASGNPVELVEYDGYCLARRAIENGDIPDSRTNIPNIIKMKVRTDDVFLIAYPKAVHMYHCPWHVYMLDWERFMLEHTELDVLIVNYEDLSNNPTKEIRKIAEFLDVKNTADFYNKMAEKCSFKQLKQDYVKRDKGGVLFRKGGVGGWKDWFTVSQNERFDKFLKDKIKDSAWKFIYEL